MFIVACCVGLVGLAVRFGEYIDVVPNRRFREAAYGLIACALAIGLHFDPESTIEPFIDRGRAIAESFLDIIQNSSAERPRPASP